LAQRTNAAQAANAASAFAKSGGEKQTPPQSIETFSAPSAFAKSGGKEQTPPQSK
jgi:hypothetical protein